MHRLRSFFVVVLPLLGLFCLPACAPASLPARPPLDDPADALPNLLTEASAAVNARSFDKLAPFVSGNAKTNFSWITETTTKNWKSGVLTVPQTGGEVERFAVFYEWHTCESDGDHLHRLVKTENGFRLGEEIKETDPFGLKITRHTFQFKPDVLAKRLFGTDAADFEVLSGRRKPFGLFRISSDFTIREMKLGDANGATVPFRQVGGVVSFVLPEKDKFSLFLQYDGVVDHTGSDYFRPNEATLDSYFYPHIARQPTTAITTLTSPPGWKPIAIGELVSDQINNDKTETVTFRNEVPVVFYTLDFGKYQVTERTYKGRTLAAYLLSSDEKLPGRCLDLLQKSLDYFEATFGPHPYKRYAVVETQGPFGGALEAYSFATFGPFTLPGTIVHELAHTWWGGVVPASYTRSMWNESFAEYSDLLFQRAQGELKLLDEAALLRTRRRLFSAFREGSLYTAHDTSDNAQSSIGYGKGPLVLRVLEDEIGKSAMISAMRAFYKGYPNGQSAEWSDFEKIVNAETKENKHPFFEQWMGRAGLPSVNLKNVLVKKTGEDYVVTGTLEQTAPAYRLRLPLVLKGEKGRISETLTLKEAQTFFTLKARFKPFTLLVDPEGIVPLALPPGTGNPLVYRFK